MLLLLSRGGSQPLGAPLPSDEHACSVSLPTWSAVVGYEEGDRAITAALQTGYPRFVYHPYVVQLMDYVVQQQQQQQQQPAGVVPAEDCLLLPTADAAARCQAFLQHALERGTTTTSGGSSVGVGLDNALINPMTAALNNNNNSTSRIRRIAVGTSNSNSNSDNHPEDKTSCWVHAVLFPAETAAGSEAKAYWQHTGEVVSSRRAERALHALNVPLRGRITNPLRVHHSAFPADAVTADAVTTTTTTASTATSPAAMDNNNNTDYNPTRELRARIAEWAGLPPTSATAVPAIDHVFLTPSGMAAIYAALRSTRRYQMMQRPSNNNNNNPDGGASIVFGFPYLDTLKVCSRPELCPGGVEFFGCGGDNDLNQLEQLLEKSRTYNNNNSNNNNTRKKLYCGIFTEVPSNPLLQCPDMYRLRALADEYDICLVVDDTIANFLNVDVLSTGLADAVCTSLTKIVSGRGDAIAGSVVTNPHTSRGRWMQRDMVAQQQQPLSQQQLSQDNNNNNINNNGLYCQDAHAILCNSTDFVERNAIINETAEQLADWLAEQPDVQTVFYPKHSCATTYHRLLRQSTSTAPLNSNINNNNNNRNKAGYGGLMSILLHPHMCQRLFYDSLDVAKGPSLGTNFTLVCPYTLLAHYHELDFAFRYNVPPNLLRISVGLESIAELKDKFGAALAQSRLYPKPSTTTITPPLSSSLPPFALQQPTATTTTRSYSTTTTVPRSSGMSRRAATMCRGSFHQAHHTLRRWTAMIR